jgi:hypothetical protein
MLVSTIKAKFKVYADQSSYNLKDSELTKVIQKANVAYFESLSNKWGIDAANQIDISPIVKVLPNITPVSNTISYSLFPDYNKVGFLKPTYVVDGVTYSFPSKLITENQMYSSLNTGTVRYPRHYVTDTGIVFEPSITPTNLFAIYLRTPYEIDFTITDYDVPITEENVEAILQIALQNMSVSQRENDQAQAVIQESIFNKQ